MWIRKILKQVCLGYIWVMRRQMCVSVYMCVFSLSLSLSAVDFSLVVPPPTGYTDSLSLIHLPSFHPQQLYYCLSSSKFLLCFLPVFTADFSQSSYRGFTTRCPSRTNISTFYLFHSLCLFSSENINFSS